MPFIHFNFFNIGKLYKTEIEHHTSLTFRPFRTWNFQCQHSLWWQSRTIRGSYCLCFSLVFSLITKEEIASNMNLVLLMLTYCVHWYQHNVWWLIEVHKWVIMILSGCVVFLKGEDMESWICRKEYLKSFWENSLHSSTFEDDGLWL